MYMHVGKACIIFLWSKSTWGYCSLHHTIYGDYGH